MDFKRASNSTDKLEEFIAGGGHAKRSAGKKEQSGDRYEILKGTGRKNTKKISDVYAGQIL